MLYQEAGYFGILMSLAGIAGKINRGRQSEAFTVAVDNTTTYQLLSANSQRIAAIISNTSGQTIYISLGDQTNLPIEILDKGALQIDVNFPWTGFVYAKGASATPGNVMIQEISVP